MDRRKFVQLAGALGSQLAWPAFAGGLGRAANTTQDSGRLILSAPLTHSDWMLKDNRPEVVWGVDGVRHMLTVLKEAGISQVYWRMFDGGRANYKSRLVTPGAHWEFDFFHNPVRPEDKALRQKFGSFYEKSDRATAERLSQIDYSNFDSFAAAIHVGHEMGLEIHAWVTINEDDHAWGARSAFSMMHPEYRWVRRDGRPYHSQMSFAFPEVMEYKLGIIKEALHYDMDGLFIDWLRTGDVRDDPQTDADGVANYGYELPLVEEFKAKYKIDPHDIPNSDPRWVAFRAEPRTLFLRSVRKLARARHQPTPISVLVANPWQYRSMGDKVAGDLKGLLIDVPTWAKEGLIDAAVPAGYYLRGSGGTPEAAYKSLQEETFGKVEVWPYEWVPKSVEAFQQSADRARTMGAKHILFWEGDYFDNPEADVRRAIAAAMSAQAVPANWQQKK